MKRSGAISAKRLRRAEDLYERACVLLGNERADKLAKFVTGATLQLAWKTGVVAGQDEHSWPTYEGDPDARGWRRFAARFWKNGHVLSTNYDELTALQNNLTRRYGAECVHLAVAYRVDNATHIGTFREGQEPYIMKGDGYQRAHVCSREGPERAEVSWGVAIDQPERRIFMPVETQIAGRIAVARCVAAMPVV